MSPTGTAENLGPVLATVGLVLLLGLAGDLLSRRLPLPRVTLLVLFGVAAGKSGLDLFPAAATSWYPFVSDVALAMVGFLLGGKLSRTTLAKIGGDVLAISVAEVAGAALAVLAGLVWLGVPLELALLLAGAAPASDPVATASVVQELRARGRFTDVLLGVVAIDDAWGLIAFSLLLALAQAFGGDGDGLQALAGGLRELGISVLVGTAVGVPAAYLTGRLSPGEPTQAEALGVVLLAAGIALWFEVSFLLTAMVMGAVIVNLARHHERAFHEIEHIEWPFMVLFFVLAGASLHVEQLGALGAVGLAYVGLRTAGLIGGAWMGALLAASERRIRRWMGCALLPQAGVALGMGLIAGNAFPELRDMILAVVIGSTVVFELAGPPLTRLALVKAGETGRPPPPQG